LSQGSILSKLWSSVAERLSSTLVKSIRERVQGYVSGLFKKFVQATLCIIVLSIGLVYVTLGFVKAAAILIPEWASFLLVGTLLILFGFLSMKLALK